MPSSQIVPSFDILCDRHRGRATSLPPIPVDELALDGSVEAFHDSVVPAVTASAHAAVDICFPQATAARAGLVEVAIEMLAAFELPALPFRDVDDIFARDLQRVDHVVIQHVGTAAADGAHRELLVFGDAELAHGEHVERCADGDRDLVPNRNAATGKREDDAR